MNRDALNKFIDAFNEVLKDRPVRYEADRAQANALVSQLSPDDWSSRSGILNHLRGVTADSLDETERPKEAELLRSHAPIVVTKDGKVEARRGSDKAHAEFLSAYTNALLNSNFDTS